MQINQPIKSCCLNLVTVTYKCYLASTVLLFACCVLPTLVVTCVISYSDCSLTRKIKRTKVKSCVYRCLKGVPMATCQIFQSRIMYRKQEKLKKTFNIGIDNVKLGTYLKIQKIQASPHQMYQLFYRFSKRKIVQKTRKKYLFF